MFIHNSRGVTLHSIHSALIQDSRGAALYSILIQDSRGVALHSTFILEVLRDVTLEVEGGACPQLRVTRASLPVEYSRLKTDHISVFKNQQRPTPPPCSLVSCPLRASRTLIIKENVSRTASEFGQAQTPVSHSFCGSSSLVPLPSLLHHGRAVLVIPRAVITARREPVWTWLCGSCLLRLPAVESVRLDY